MQEILLLAIGLVAGNITGIVGSSGVMVVVPALMLLGFSPVESIGASLFIDTIASVIVAFTYHQNKNLVIKDGLWIAAGSVLGAQGGSYLSTIIPGLGLSRSFSAFLLISAVILWINGKKNMIPDEQFLLKHSKLKGIVDFLRRYPRIFGLSLGLIVGIVSGFFGAGGGILILLILIFVMNFSMHEGIGTSTLIMAFTAASGTVGHLVTHDLPLKAALLGSLGTIIGGRLSAVYANKISEKILSRIGAVLFLILSISIFFINRRTAGS